MFDYLSLQGTTENPTFVSIIYTVLLSFLLSSLIAFTYEKTTRNVVAPIDFLQSLILVSIVAATVMQAIGDSVARGLGMLGALAIIRYRTSLRTPRNLVFTFASLAAGISCGVYGYVIGISGTIGFCTAAFVLRYSPLGKIADLTGNLKFELVESSNELPEIERILNRFCRKYKQVRYQIVQQKIKEKKTTQVEPIIEEINLVPIEINSNGGSSNTVESAIKEENPEFNPLFNRPKKEKEMDVPLESKTDENNPDPAELKKDKVNSVHIEFKMDEELSAHIEADKPQPVLFEKLFAFEYELRLRKVLDGEALDIAINELKTVRSVKINLVSSPENV